MNLLDTISRVTKHLLTLFMLMVVAVSIGSWKSHSHTLNLQEADKAVRIDNSGGHRALLKLIIYCRASI
jgi:hypothetical protein